MSLSPCNQGGRKKRDFILKVCKVVPDNRFCALSGRVFPMMLQYLYSCFKEQDDIPYDQSITEFTDSVWSGVVLPFVAVFNKNPKFYFALQYQKDAENRKVGLLVVVCGRVRCG